MKNIFKLFGNPTRAANAAKVPVVIIAIAAIIGFTMIACSDSDDLPVAAPGTGSGPSTEPGTTMGSGTFAGKDVLGNSYTLSVGSSASRSALRNDRVNLDVRTRDGTTRQVRGTVTNIAADGTLTIQADGSNAAFTANVSGNSLNTVVAADPKQPIPFTSGSSIVPRTFDVVHLRATRWSDSNSGTSGENWGSGTSVLERDFPTRISKFNKSNPYENEGQYEVTIQGISDVDLGDTAVEVQGLTSTDEWVYLGGVRLNESISAGTRFNITGNLVFWSDHNLKQYKEVILQFQNTMIHNNPSNPSENINHGSIPADIANGTIMATISDFSISIRDKLSPWSGNMPNYTFGYAQDGLSITYSKALWTLNSDLLALAKQKGVLEINVGDDIDLTDGWVIGFAWQDPSRNLWWQDGQTLTGENADDPTAVEWDAATKTAKIDLSKIIKDSNFDSVTNELKLIFEIWWHPAETFFIEDLGIKGAELKALLAP